MNLQDEILREHSKAQCNRIVQWVGNSQPRFNELFHLFLTGEYRVVQRASWPVSYCVEAHPELVRLHFSKLVKKLQEKKLQVAVKRNAMRLLQHVKIPAAFHGKIMNICFDYVQDPAEAIAVKVFALTVLVNLSECYPDIVPEIKLIIETQWPHSTPAFKSRAAHIMKYFARHPKTGAST